MWVQVGLRLSLTFWRELVCPETCWVSSPNRQSVVVYGWPLLSINLLERIVYECKFRKNYAQKRAALHLQTDMTTCGGMQFIFHEPPRRNYERIGLIPLSLWFWFRSQTDNLRWPTTVFILLPTFSEKLCTIDVGLCPSSVFLKILCTNTGKACPSNKNLERTIFRNKSEFTVKWLFAITYGQALPSNNLL